MGNHLKPVLIFWFRSVQDTVTTSLRACATMGSSHKDSWLKRVVEAFMIEIHDPLEKLT